MSDVVALDDMRPHHQGPVVCTKCQHSWTAVRPHGTGYLECPKCGAVAGGSLSLMLGYPEYVLGNDCCGKVDSAGTCCAPACIRGTALKLIDSIRMAYALEYPNE